MLVKPYAASYRAWLTQWLCFKVRGASIILGLAIIQMGKVISEIITKRQNSLDHPATPPPTSQ